MTSMNSQLSLSKLISALKVLPGVGPKSAQRMAFYLLQHNRDGALSLAKALDEALTKVIHCTRCNTFSETEICDICCNESRSQHQLMVVEMPSDLVNLEASRCYDGQYFVLMGRISPLEGVGPKDIALEKLVARVLDGLVEEVVIATNFTAEGEATAHVIAELLKNQDIKLSRIARGMPVGGELEYVDRGTLAQAVYERKPI